MKGPSSCCRFFLRLVLATTIACGNPLRADLLVTAPNGNHVPAGPGSPAFVPHGPRPMPVNVVQLDADQQLLLQMLTVMTIPTGPLSWNNNPPPPPPPPKVPPGTPPNGGPPDPGPPTVKSPEPSTLVLATVGAGFLGWRRCRSRKTARTEETV
jgi:hypothetical protein